MVWCYRRTRDSEHKATYVAACRDKHDVFDQKKKRYWSERITTEGDSPMKLLRSLTSLLQRDKQPADDVTATCNDADAFMRFFDDKVKAVRAAMNGRQLPATTSVTDASLCSEDEVRRLIMQSPTKSCALDPIPTFLLKSWSACCYLMWLPWSVPHYVKTTATITETCCRHSTAEKARTRC